MSPSTTARPEVMYSKAKPLALARSTMQPRESSSGSAGSPAEHDVGAGEADAEARVGRALDEEPAALGAVGERLADRAVDPLARRRSCPSGSRPCRRASSCRRRPGRRPRPGTTTPQALKAPKPWPATEPPLKLELGQHVASVALRAPLVDPGPGDRTRELGAEHAVVGVGRARELDRGRTSPANTLVGEPGDLAPTPAWAPSGSAAPGPGPPRRGPRPAPPRRPAGRSARGRGTPRAA